MIWPRPKVRERYGLFRNTLTELTISVRPSKNRKVSEGTVAWLVAVGTAVASKAPNEQLSSARGLGDIVGRVREKREVGHQQFPAAERLALRRRGWIRKDLGSRDLPAYQAVLPLVTVLAMVLTRLAVSWGGPVAHSRAASGARYSDAAFFAALPILQPFRHRGHLGRHFPKCIGGLRI